MTIEDVQPQQLVAMFEATSKVVGKDGAETTVLRDEILRRLGYVKPFGHSVKICRRVPVAAKKPLDTTYREETIEIHRRGGRRVLERAARLVRGFIRLDSEIQEYTREEWVRMFGTGNERGTAYGRV